MPEWAIACVGAFMWAQGFIFGGIVYGRSPFWDGVRSGYSLGLARHLSRNAMKNVVK